MGTNDLYAEPAPLTDDLYALHLQHARALVVAEVEDILTQTSADAPPTAQYEQAAKAVVSLPVADQLSVLVETAAIAGEAIIRLAQARSEDPRATWDWLMSTEWTRAALDTD